MRRRWILEHCKSGYIGTVGSIRIGGIGIIVYAGQSCLDRVH